MCWYITVLGLKTEDILSYLSNFCYVIGNNDKVIKYQLIEVTLRYARNAS